MCNKCSVAIQSSVSQGQIALSVSMCRSSDDQTVCSVTVLCSVWSWQGYLMISVMHMVLFVVFRWLLRRWILVVIIWGSEVSMTTAVAYFSGYVYMTTMHDKMKNYLIHFIDLMYGKPIFKSLLFHIIVV